LTPTAARPEASPSAFPEIGVELPLAELYEGIVFDDGPDGDQPAEETR